jgi:hypothetical protein
LLPALFNLCGMKNLLVLTFCTIIFTVHPVLAQVQRNGFNVGVAAGAGLLTLHVPGESKPRKSAEPSFPNIQLGWMIGPKTAITLYLPGTLYKNTWNGRPRDRGFEGIIPGVQYWVTERWWVAGGVGFGLDAPAFYDIKNEDERKFHFGYGCLFSSGYEFWQTSHFSMDARVRLHYNNVPVPEGRLSGFSANALLGVSWW